MLSRLGIIIIEWEKLAGDARNKAISDGGGRGDYNYTIGGKGSRNSRCYRGEKRD